MRSARNLIIIIFTINAYPIISISLNIINTFNEMVFKISSKDHIVITNGNFLMFKLSITNSTFPFISMNSSDIYFVIFFNKNNCSI
ncbi:hypothetical protein C1646_722196 [Rhizophagus diaphanus]|nr:hypothetical protein C1646_722196 [Rhizophagus diaphanus] [Rhizophagus sp. MUCL 43196]